MPRRVPTVYRIYDEADRLLYAGVTWITGARLSKHRRAGWSWMARTCSLEEFPTWGLAERGEYHVIQDEGPLYNRDRSQCFQGTALEARAAIPADLVRRPLRWNIPPRPGRSVWPSRLVYAEFGHAVLDLPDEAARKLATGVRGTHPDQASILDGEQAGVPDPWGDHGIVAYALRFGLLQLDDVKPHSVISLHRTLAW